MSTNVKSLVKVAASMVAKVLFYLFVGVLINWVFAFVVLWSFGEEMNISKVLLLVVFFAGFPFIYAWNAKGHAINVGLGQLYDSSQWLFQGLVSKVTTGVVMGVEKTSSIGITSGVVKKASDIAKKTEKIPGPIRMIVNFFLNQIPLKESLSEVGQQVELKSENLETINTLVFEKVNEYVKDELLDTGSSWFITVLLVNGAVIAACYYFFL